MALSFIFNVYSQSNYKKGYVITLNNDTIFGLIDFRTDIMNSQFCKFKPDTTDSEVIYRPGEIESYRILNEGKYYVSRTVEIENVKRTVFLEFLVQGLLNLYYFPEEYGYYFFENKEGKIIGITKKPDEITEDRKIKKDNRYKGVLSYVLREDISLALKSADVAFGRKSMIEYTKDYHEDMCESGEKCIIFENDYKKKFTKINVNAFSGIELNEVNFLNVEIPKMLSISPNIGVGLNISSPRVVKSLSLMIDASLSKIAGACDYSVDLRYFQYKFSGMKSNFTGGLEYIYHKGKIRPAISAGFSYCKFFNLNGTWETYFQTYENVILIQNSSLGFKTGLGVDYQIKENQFIVLRFLYSKHLNNYDMNNTYQLKLGYKF